MSLTIEQGRDEISNVFKTALDASAFSSAVVLYDNTKTDVPEDGTGTWIRFGVRHNTGGQATLSGEVGTKRYRRTGLISIQCFLPINKGSQDGDAISQVFVDAFENPTPAGEVLYRSVVPTVIGVSGSWFQVNIIGQFEYDEVK